MADEKGASTSDATAVMEAGSKEFGQLYAQLRGSAAKAATPTADLAKEGKADSTPKSTDTGKTDTKAEAKPDESAKLQDKIEGLQKELARVRADRREDRSKDDRIAKLEGQIEAMQAAQKANGQKSVKDFSLEELDALEVDWMAYLAKGQQDESAEAVAKAKANLAVIRKEQRERVKQASKEKLEQEAQTETLKQEMLAMYEDLYAQFPDMRDKDSALFKAAEKEYQQLPKALQDSGPVGDLRAILKAINKHPDLAQRGEKPAEARKDLLKNLEQAADKALHAGGGNAAITPTPNIDALPRDKFEDLVKRMKLGQGLTI